MPLPTRPTTGFVSREIGALSGDWSRRLCECDFADHNTTLPFLGAMGTRHYSTTWKCWLLYCLAHLHEFDPHECEGYASGREVEVLRDEAQTRNLHCQTHQHRNQSQRWNLLLEWQSSRRAEHYAGQIGLFVVNSVCLS